MSLNVDAIQKEIESLRGERSAAQERISYYSQRGRGRGRGRGRDFGEGRGPHSHYARSIPQNPSKEGSQEPPIHRKAAGLSASLQSRLGSRPSQGDRAGRSGDLDGKQDRPQRPFMGNRDEHDHRVGRAAWKRRFDNSYNRDEPDPAEPSNAEPLPGSNTGRLASAVVTDASQPVEELASKRPLENGKANPEVKKRNKRLFGSLLGTLQKFQEEDQRFKRSRLSQNRVEAETRAAEKAVLEEQRLIDQRKQDLAKARVAEINKKKELDVQLQSKEYEMWMTKRIAQEMKHIGWLRTAVGPPLLWLPRHHNENTQLLLEQRSIELDAWKDDQLLKMEKQKTQILDRFKPVPQPLPRRPLEAPKEEDNEPEEGMIIGEVTDRFAGDVLPEDEEMNVEQPGLMEEG